jgi:hypothetical protein
MLKIVKACLVLGGLLLSGVVMASVEEGDPTLVHTASFLNLKDRASFSAMSRAHAVAAKHATTNEMREIFSTQSSFVLLDQKLENYFQERSVKDAKKALVGLKSHIQVALSRAKPEVILVFNAGSLFLKVFSEAASGVSASGTTLSVGLTTMRMLGLAESSAKALLGPSHLAAVAADGYRFFSKAAVADPFPGRNSEIGSGDILGLTPPEKAAHAIQQKRFTDFQKSLNAHYVLMRDIVQEDGNLNQEVIDKISSTLESLKLHVVMDDAEIEYSSEHSDGVTKAQCDKNRVAMGTFFGDHPEAVAVLNVGKTRVQGDRLDLGSHLPMSIKNLIITNTRHNVRAIKDRSLAMHRGLTSLDLRGLTNVTTIGNNFLSSCSELTSLDLRGLTNVTTIGSFFLDGCSGLTSLDLRGLTNVTTIGNGFLSGCSELIFLDLRGLTNVREIGDYFLANCTGLISLDLSPLSKVTTIGRSFLFMCNTKMVTEALAKQVSPYLAAYKRSLRQALAATPH